MSEDLELQVHCHINENGENDRFVGIKFDNGHPMVYFPLGYNVSEKNENIRTDIIQLIAVLTAFAETKDQLLVTSNNLYSEKQGLPISAYFTIIRFYLEQQRYYSEKEKVRRTGDKGKIDWTATLKRNVAFYQKDGTPFLKNYTIKGTTPNENKVITKIHKFCVYEAFEKVGWIFTSFVPENPHIELNKNLFLSILKRKRASIFNDNDKLLFEAMISVLEFLDEDNSNRTRYFGTDRFEYIWEKLIDNVFGIANKDDYFPKTYWHLKNRKEKNNHALEPDTIMKCDEEIYVLDAKYYRYGITGNPHHLPQSASINKQITYGEYANKKTNVDIYNAFLMPYNQSDNPFEITEKNIENIGEARSEWKSNAQVYERVQGIVIDTRFLINSYFSSHSSAIYALARAIKDAIKCNEDNHLV